MALAKLDIFENNWVDLVFKNRNHEYGAYVLRKKSIDFTNKGIIYAIIFFTLAIATPVIVKYIEGIIPDTKEVKITDVNKLAEPPPIDKNQPPPPPPPEPPPLKSTVKFTPPEIKKDEEVPQDEPPPTQDEMKDKDASKKTEEGDVNGIDKSLLDGTGDNVTGDAAPEILPFAEQMPEFEGGEEALGRYLKNHIQYPPMARENNIERRVVIQFVVGLDGKITDVGALSKHGWGLEDEAMRVVKAMPPWKPGKQNGKTVIVRYQLPVVFKLAN